MYLSSQATTTKTAAITERPRHRGAGNKLSALLEAQQEDSLSEDVEAAVSVKVSGGDNGGDSEVPIKHSSKEGKPKSGDVSENLEPEPILCCVCFELVLDSDTVVWLPLVPKGNNKPL